MPDTQKLVVPVPEAPPSLKCKTCDESTIFKIAPLDRKCFCGVMNLIVWNSAKPQQILDECTSWTPIEQPAQ